MKKFWLLIFVGIMLTSAMYAQRSRLKLPSHLLSEKRQRPVVEGTGSANEVVPSSKIETDGIESDLGTTYYDLQSNACTPFGRVYIYPDGTKAAVWTMSQQTASWTDRGTGYNYFNGTTWGSAPNNRIESVRTAWPSYAPCGANGEIVIAHQSGTAPLVISKRTNKGTGAWSQSYLAGPSGSSGLLWPRLITTGTDHNTVHVLALTAPTANGGTVYQNQDGALVYCRSTDGGATFGSWSILTGLDVNYYLNFGGDSYSFLIPNGNNVAFVITDPDKDMIVMKSTNNGVTWQKSIAYEHPYPFFASTTVAPRFSCPDGSAHGLIDNSGVVHLAFGINAASCDGTAISWYPWEDGLGYWNSTLPIMDSATINPDYLFNEDRLIGWMQDINGDGELTLVSTGGGYSLYYLGPTSFPQLIMDASGKMYAIFSSVTETFNNGVQDYRHIWARTSEDNGQTWGDFMDLTGDIFHIFDECVFPAVSPTLDNDYPAIIYQRDSEPGMSVRGDTDPATVNTITYMIIDDFPNTGVANPASFNATPISSAQIDLNWTLNSSNNNVIVAWSPTGTFGTPSTGTNYLAGSGLPGGGTVLYNGSALNFSHTGLTPLTTYYYKAFSYDSGLTYSGGILTNAATLAVNLAVSPSNQNVTAATGSTNFTVTTTGTWTAVSNQTWCTVTPSGTGNGTLVANYSENTTTSQRLATITVSVNGASPVNVTVTQAAAAPTLAVSPSNQNVTSAAGTTLFTVSSNTSWTCVSNASWCLVTTSGTGNGTIYANYTENTSTTQRVASITVTASGVAPVIITVTQAGATPFLSVSPSNQNVGSPAGSTSFSVSSNTSWIAVSDQTWCTVTPSGTGNGILAANFTENTSTLQRVANITVTASGATPVIVTVTQAGVGSIYLNVTPANQNVGSAPGNTNFTVSSNTAWNANSNQTWCTVTPSGNGNGIITATFTENTSTVSRIATINVSGTNASPVSVTVTQEGAAPTLTIQPLSQTVGGAAGTTFFNIFSNSTWEATSLNDWCTVTPSGSGNGLLQADYQANNNLSTRTANILVTVPGLNPQVVQVIQLSGIVGITELSSKFMLAPNPSDGNFTLFVSPGLTNKIEVSIVDVSGKVLLENTLSGSESYEFALGGYKAGIYFVRITYNTEVMVYKLILK